MKDDAEYITNWHKYDEADGIVKMSEALVAALEKFPHDLHRTEVKEHAAECLRKARKLSDDLWYLRRCCDQHAG